MFVKLKEAIKEYNVSRFDILLKSMPECAFTNGNKTVVHYAIRSNHFHFVDSILDHKDFNPNCDPIQTLELLLQGVMSSRIPIFLSHPKLSLKIFGSELFDLCNTYSSKRGLAVLQSRGIYNGDKPIIHDYNSLTEFKKECDDALTNGLANLTFKIAFVFDITVFVQEGFTPAASKKDEVEFFITRNGGNPELCTQFWCNLKSDLRYLQNWEYSTLDYCRKRALQFCDSFNLLFHNRDALYPSLRPITDMRLFKTPACGFYDEFLLDKERLEVLCHEGFRSYVPVTRYSKGMSRGLYYNSKGKRPYTGTFYYLECSSSTLLTFDKERMREYKNKYEAALDMCPAALDGAFNASPWHKKFLSNPNQTTVPDDLMLTPKELIKVSREVESESFMIMESRVQKRLVDIVPQTKEYAGVVLGLFALEDALDEDLFFAAKKADIDILVFRNMVGSRKVVSEVFDIRDREKSFASLLYER